MVNSRTGRPRLLLLVLPVLAACAGRPSPAAPAADTDCPIPTPTLMAYWDRMPPFDEPVGGWTTQRMEEVNLAFEYPSVYGEAACGRVFSEDKVTDKYACRLIGFDGGTIRIHVYSVWTEGLDEFVSQGKAPAGLHMFTAVEAFSLDGVPAYRYVAQVPNSPALEYVKAAGAMYDGRLYTFDYTNLIDCAHCSAWPLSEEAVYEHLLATLDFLP